MICSGRGNLQDIVLYSESQMERKCRAYHNWQIRSKINTVEIGKWKMKDLN